MKILKPTAEQVVYDNLYAKPASCDDWTPHSVVVSYSVNNVLYYGQYNSETRKWSTIPSDEHKREFLDRDVQYWFYNPGFEEIFKCEIRSNRESITRSREYNPDVEEPISKKSNHKPYTPSLEEMFKLLFENEKEKEYVPGETVFVRCLISKKFNNAYTVQSIGYDNSDQPMLLLVNKENIISSTQIDELLNK